MPTPAKPEGKSITRSLTTGITATVLIVSLLAVAAMYHAVSHFSKKSLEQRSEEITAYLIGALESPLWEISEKQIELTANAVYQDESVASLTVKDDDGKVVFSRSKKFQGDLITRSGKIIHKTGNSESVIGEVSVSLAQTKYHSLYHLLFAYSIIVIFLILASIVIVTRFLIRSTLRRPLEALTEIAGRYASGIYDTDSSSIPYREFLPFNKVLAQMATRIDEQIRLAREAEARYRGIFENTIEGIFQSTREGRFLMANPAMARILGYDSPEQLISSVTDIQQQLYVNSEDREEIFSILSEHEVLTEREIKFHRKDKQQIWVLLRARLIRDEKGKPIQLEGLLADITDRKLAEENLHQVYKSLEQKVEERTAANRQLQDALAEREVLLKEIHHRVKNNLQIVSSLLDLQTNTINDDHTKGYFLESRNRIHAMAMIHEMLYQTSDFVVIDFARYLDRLTSTLFQVYEPGGRVSRTVDVHEADLCLDEAIPCGLIVNELVSNALKYAFPDDREGGLKVGLYGNDNDMITLTVEDDGIGLPASLDYRETETLGLQLVNLLVRQLRGTIELESTPGTFFRIQFPKNQV